MSISVQRTWRTALAATAVAAVGGLAAVVLWGVGGSEDDPRDRFPDDFAASQPAATAAPEVGGVGAPPRAAPAPFVAYAGTGASSADREDVVFNALRMQKLLGVDAIRPIYEPEFVSALDTHLEDRDYVLALSVNGDARAYPVDTLNFREMVNDVVGGVPVLVTW